MKTVAVMQPTYLSWIGYFGMLEQVDSFVILDSVQFSKRSWQQRNKIKTPDGEQWLTVPVLTKGLQQQKIKDVLVDQSRSFNLTHKATIEANYKKSPFYSEYSPAIFSILDKQHQFLSDLNLDLIILFCQLLGINTPIKKASEMEVAGTKDALLANICEFENASDYLSAQGSKIYLDESDEFIKKSIEIKYFNYEHPHYPQLFEGFIQYLSIVDLLFNTGSESLSIIKSGIT